MLEASRLTDNCPAEEIFRLIGVILGISSRNRMYFFCSLCIVRSLESSTTHSHRMSIIHARIEIPQISCLEIQLTVSSRVTVVPVAINIETPSTVVVVCNCST